MWAHITGYSDSDMMARALAQGPFGVMKKPFGGQGIAATVSSFLRINTAKPLRLAGGGFAMISWQGK